MNTEHLVFVDFHHLENNARHRRAIKRQKSNPRTDARRLRNQDGKRIIKETEPDLETFDLPETTRVTIRGYGDPITLDLVKKPHLAHPDKTAIFSLSESGNIQKKLLKKVVKKVDVHICPYSYFAL